MAITSNKNTFVYLPNQIFSRIPKLSVRISLYRMPIYFQMKYLIGLFLWRFNHLCLCQVEN